MSPRHVARAATAALLVVLAVAGCGRVSDRLHPGTGAPASQTSGASPAATSPASPGAREDEPTPTSTVAGPAAADVAELQQALDAADQLADEVDQDMASDGS